MSKTYAPLFPARVEDDVPPDCESDLVTPRSRWRAWFAYNPPPFVESDESTLVRSPADRWRFFLIWRDEPSDQFEGVENCPCVALEDSDG